MNLRRTPLSATAGTPISYAANVNRQKTKKWTQAKTVDYGGDDWGDDYDDYEEESPPPLPKPTGLRQPGQAAVPAQDTKPYGNLPQLPNETRRSATNPILERSNSFDRGDEKRAFSTQMPPHPASPERQPPASTQGPPALHVQTRQPSAGLRKPVQVKPVMEANSADPIPASTTSSKYSQESGFTANPPPREKFSPPPTAPLSQAQGSSSSAPLNSDPTSNRFPPRKSSIGQSSKPDLAVVSPPIEVSKPWTDVPASPSSSKSSNAGKALPFIRPADIYKRHLEEQAEKQRQSLDSGRPSMDSNQGSAHGRSSERSTSPARLSIPEPGQTGFSSAQRRSVEVESEPSYDSSGSYDHYDSRGRLMPVLEPVKERKSEYGFDNYDTTSFADPSVNHSMLSSEGLKSNQDDIDAQRRFSTSPKLPDLNRMSGFGMDMFLKSSTEDVPPVPTRQQDETTPIALAPSSASTEKGLREQPSQGFTSAVHQAFDAHVGPETSASSSVRRTDSESTGTTGISPIMSRVPSSATEARAREAETRDRVGPAIPEEPESRRCSLVEDAGGKPSVSTDAEASTFQPGHRREISAPSPGNSPARTPQLAARASGMASESAHISEGSATYPEDDEVLEAPQRPFAAEREQSFRPNLPGGWVSYGTTNTGAPDGRAASSASSTKRLDEDDDVELTPTTQKTALPKTALGAAAAAVGLGNRNPNITSANPAQMSSSNREKDAQLPTPDDTMAPSGNPYTTTLPDHRLGATAQRPLLETQLSSASTIPPTPPRKDSPLPSMGENEAAHDSLSFPPTAPLKQKSAEHVGSDVDLLPPRRPEMLPTLSTATSPQDDDNDKLRKEIIKSLSPKVSGSGINHSISSPISEDDEQVGRATRESTYLPSEYDNYWADTGDEPEVPEIPPHVKPETALEPASELQENPSSQSSVEHEQLSTIAPLKTGKSAEDRPDMEKKRFSWEGPSEEASITSKASNVEDKIPVSSSTVIPDSTEHQNHESYNASVPAVPVAMAPNVSDEMDKSIPPAYEDENMAIPEDRHESPFASQAKAGTLAAGGIGAMAAASWAARRGSDEPSPAIESSRRLSLAEEKNPVNASQYSIVPTPPEEEHPLHVSQTLRSPTEQVTRLPPPDTSRITQFKDILAMNSSESRIRAYNDSRRQFAIMETGLADWILLLKSDFPQVAAGLGANNSRPKQGRTGTTPPPLQQPYYQQYLNASSPTATTPPALARPTTAGLTPSGQQGFSSGGSKMSSQQVQAKGKELLSSAGKFGKMASGAGKGLLSKGKSKLRGNGAGDKVD